MYAPRVVVFKPICEGEFNKEEDIVFNLHKLSSIRSVPFIKVDLMMLFSSAEDSMSRSQRLYEYLNPALLVPRATITLYHTGDGEFEVYKRIVIHWFAALRPATPTLVIYGTNGSTWVWKRDKAGNWQDWTAPAELQCVVVRGQGEFESRSSFVLCLG